MISSMRLSMETEILKKYFPNSFRWYLDTSPCKLEITIKTNSKKMYKLCLHLPDDYPNSPPKMIIISPSYLPGYRGERLDQTSASQHTLESVDGHVQICHYRPSHWSPQITLYKVIIKGRLWLEAYEKYLETGNPIDSYLPHQ